MAKHARRQPPVKLTHRGEVVVATAGLLALLFVMALVGGIEAGTLL